MLLTLLTPRSLYARFLLMIILPVILVQMIALYLFYENHWSSLSRKMSHALSGEVAWIVEQFKTTNPDHYPILITQAQKTLGLQVVLHKATSSFTDVPAPTPYPEIINLRQHLAGIVEEPLYLTLEEGEDTIAIHIQLPEHSLIIQANRKRLVTPSTYIFSLWIIGSALLLTVIAILFLRVQVRSILRLADAAEHFGKGQDIPDFRPQGAKEVRRAAIAFIEMRERIKRLLTRRTQMLAGISHDLRTPLTRMKLQLELMPGSESVTSLQNDVHEMQTMLEGYLNFVRGEGNEATETVNLAVYIEEVLTSYPQSVHTSLVPDIHVPVKPSAMRRCLCNIMDNGLRHGNQLWISTSLLDGTHVVITIDDDGDSIPEEEWEHVFQPFYRVDPSRNPDTGGVGLGLSITRDIIHRHGGEISLQHAPTGGLRVIIILPL